MLRNSRHYLEISLLIIATTWQTACQDEVSQSLPISSQVITDWNLRTVQATKTAGLNSNLATRIIAIESIAVYDAVNSVLPFGTPYHYKTAVAGNPSAVAAAAQAAHDVLTTYFPTQKPSLDSALTRSLATLPATTDVAGGQAVGTAAATDIVALRAADGSTPNQGYAGPGTAAGVGQWRPTPTDFANGINQQWALVKPFVLTAASQFRPAAPPALGSDAYKTALAEVETLGAVGSTVRTADQTQIAQFYRQDAELAVNEAARLLTAQKQLSIQEAALVFVLTDIATADARIAVWDAKYTYLFWRPVTALNATATGAVTNNYAAWTPLIVTPAHPSYPSGHSGTVNAGFDVLTQFFGDANSLTLHTTTAGVAPRTVASLSTLEAENGLSRIYGGIHFSFENTAGQRIGSQVASYVLANGPKKK